MNKYEKSIITETIMTHISSVRVGDTVIHNGEMKTVSGSNIKHDKFWGTSIFGDGYKFGSKLVEVVKLGVNMR